ncbi:MAG: hypothetical protein WC859_09015 [Elusimicrobiota bacterium]|jgi:hypothetical protein
MNRKFIVICILLAAGPSLAAAQTSEPPGLSSPSGAAAAPPSAGTSGALLSSNILNPNLSVVGWFQSEAGHPHDPGHDAEPALQLKETEIAFQAIVDPWARGDFFLSFDSDGNAELEEGYVTWFHLPAGLGLRGGKFRSYFGPFNRTHPHDTPFATRPLVERNYLGEDGLAGTGAGLSWLIPNPWVYLNADFEALRPPEVTDSPAFDRAQRRDLLYTARLNSYFDLTDAANVSYGGSYAYGPSGQQLDPVTLNSSNTLHSQLYSVDVTFRWKNPARAIYRSLIWQTEALWNKHDNSTSDTQDSRGLMSWLQYQFAQRWAAGGRYDYSQFPTDSSLHEYGGLVFLTYSPTEFSHLSLQGSHVNRSDGLKEDLGLLRVTFNIGPHGAHAF